MGGRGDLRPIVSKIFCSPSLTTLMVRKRPHVVSGGGFVVTDCRQKVVFAVDGCGVLGRKGNVVVKDGEGSLVLDIHKKEGIIQVLRARHRWKGYLMDYEGEKELVFSMAKEPRTCFSNTKVTRIRLASNGRNDAWDFEVVGSFPERACAITDRKGNVVAQVTAKEMMGSKDFYSVEVQPGYDQAFVIGAIAVLDNMHGESTRC